MSHPFPDAPVRLWLLPHPHRARGEPHVRPVLCEALGCREDELPLSRGSEGRPMLGPPYQDFDAGWSHSGDALLLALGQSLQLGVDIEQVRPRPRARELAQRFFHGDEVRWLAAQPDEAMAFSFVRLWCAKEAVLKAHGHGIGFGLARVTFDCAGETPRMTDCDAELGNVADWRLHAFAPEPGYLAVLAHHDGILGA